MINNSKLNRKILQITEYANNEDSIVDSHKLSLCLTLLHILDVLGEERTSILPFSFKLLGRELNEYIKNQTSDDASYLICASFLKEYYLYKKYIDNTDFENSSVYGVWNEFNELNVPISNYHKFLNYDYYKKIKSDEFLENFYFGLSIQEKNIKSNFEKLKEVKESCLEEINNRKGILNDEIKDFDKNITKLKNDVKQLELSLKKQKIAFNFVGLSEGFENILKKKTRAKWTSFVLLSLITLSMFTILGYYRNTLPNEPTEIFDFWKFSMPYLGLEFILLYLFRVVIKHYNSIQTQIMQIELRQSLCQFIQSYADYAKEIKEKNGASLDKFENLIFSSIVSTSEQVPSTFDGLEHITNLFKSAKS